MAGLLVGIARIVCEAGFMHLSPVRPSVCLSVCLIRPPHVTAAGLLLWARRPGDIDFCTAGGQPAVSSSRAAAWCSAVNAGSATLSANVGKSTQTH